MPSLIGLLSLTAVVSAQGLSFDPREATISSTHHSLYTGLTTCREVVSSFLSRIEALNNHTNAIISLNPHALAAADSCDAQLQSNNGSFGALFCIPTLLKDNYDTAELPTTGGNLALQNSKPSLDAPVVAALKKAGAIIMGKANLHELALEGLSVSSVGGGSSGGTGASIAASFSVFGSGSDTVNSLRSPASANSLFSCRPTRGLISRKGIIPISYTQDVIGPIARSVEDVATALTVMSSIGYDAADNATALAPPGIQGTDYTASLKQGSLKGLRIGLLEGFFNRTASGETTPVNQAMANVTAKLRRAGVTIVPITESLYNASAISALLDTQRYEYRQEMDAYLQRPSLKGQHPETLKELYATPPGDFLVIPSQYDYVSTSLISSTSNATYAAVQAGIQNLTLALRATFAVNKLDAMIYPEQKNLVVPIGSASQSGRNGILAALTGTPVVTIPIGFSPASATAPEGVPVGMELLGLPFTEAMLLQVAYQIEAIGRVRRTPKFAQQVVEMKQYEAVPSVKPHAANIPKEYPIGVL
ncbi:hypothetical protein LTS10_004915 [Elasticomyces elasticus]|nr:hypothetical protein LTS10_004915 [Elasticomyces elasticus]